MNKRKCQQKHACTRARQRYGLFLSLSQLDEIVKMIQQNKARFVARQSHRVSIWEIDWDGKKARVVYDNQRKMIASFLPPEAWEN